MKKLVFVLMGLVCSLVIVSHPTCGQNGFDEALEVTDEFEDSAKVETTIDDELESERQLKKLLKFVTPLMAILRRSNATRSSVRSARSYKRNYYDLSFGNFNRNNRFNRNDYVDRDSYGYGGSSYGGGYGGGCCDKKDDLLPLLALLGLAGLLLYLIAIASTT